MTDRATPAHQRPEPQHRRRRVRQEPLQTTVITRNAIPMLWLVLAMVALGAAVIGVVAVLLWVR